MSGRVRPVPQLAGPGRPDLAGRAVDWLRLAVVPLLAVGSLVPVEGRAETGFAFALVGYAGYAVLRLWRPGLLSAPGGDLVGLVVDVVAISALATLSGGGFSVGWHAYLLLPIAAAFEYMPRVTALVGVVATAAFLVQAAADSSARADGAWSVIAARAAYLLWVSTACTALAAVLTRRGQRVRDLLDARERLLIDALDAGDRARSAMAESLHDHALQDLLVVRQELAEAPDSAEVRRARAAVELTRTDVRDAVAALHPYVLDAVGLADALRRAGELAARRGGFALELDLDEPSARQHDRLLYTAARELLNNAAKHARASTVRVSLHESAGRVVLVVADDGAGADAAALDAVAGGHIGIATQRARVQAAGGSFEVASSPGAGTSVRIALPA